MLKCWFDTFDTHRHKTIPGDDHVEQDCVEEAQGWWAGDNQDEDGGHLSA